MRKYFILMLMFIFILSLAGCEKDDSENSKVDVIDNSESNTIDIYYPGEKQIEKAKDKYQLKQPDSIAASVEEVMGVMSTKLYESILYQTYMLDADNNVSLEFSVDVEISREQKLLAKAAIAETLFQITGVNSIKIKFTDDEGNIIDDGLYLPESFYFYE